MSLLKRGEIDNIINATSTLATSHLHFDFLLQDSKQSYFAFINNKSLPKFWLKYLLSVWNKKTQEICEPLSEKKKTAAGQLWLKKSPTFSLHEALRLWKWCVCPLGYFPFSMAGFTQQLLMPFVIRCLHLIFLKIACPHLPLHVNGHN